MELIEKIFKPLLTLAVLVWMVLAVTQSLTTAQLLIYVGVLSVLMGVRNLLILNEKQCQGVSIAIPMARIVHSGVDNFSDISGSL